MLFKLNTGIILTFLMTLIAFSARAEISVIVNPSISDSVSKSDIQKIFLGKQKKLPGGLRVIPVVLERGIEARDIFNAEILKKSESQLKAYWSRLVFTGKAQPPKEVETEAELIKLVENNPNIIGYIDANQLTENVKAILSF